MSNNKIKKVQGNDSFQRMNYLYQIGKYMAESNQAMSAYYGNLIISVAKKNVLKIHPGIKRQMCKKCRCFLVNNVTMKQEIKNRNHIKQMEWTCKVCYTKRDIPVCKKKNKSLWIERPEAVVEIIN